jgi:hypothetical protein
MKFLEWVSLILVALVFAFVWGCDRSNDEQSEGASYADDIAAICQAPANCEECNLAPPDQRMQMLARQILNEVETAEARVFFESLGEVEPAERVRLLRAQAEEVGVEPCRLAELWEPQEP